MSDPTTTFGLIVFFFICIFAFVLALVGTWVYRKRALPAWRGFVLGGFTGTLAGMLSLAALFLIYFH